VLAAATTFLFWTSGGWARFYLIDLPRNHGYDWSNLVGFWTTTMLPNFGLAAPFVLVFLVATDGRRPGTTAFYALMAGGLIAMSWVSLLNIGGAPNSLPPAYAGLALLFGLGVQPTLRRCERRRLGPFQAAPLVLVLMALALGRLEYVATDPAPLAPNARAGQRLVQAIAALPGPVFAPDFGEFQHQAGKGDQAHTTNYQELLGFYGGAVLPEGRQWLNDLEAALAARRFAYVLVDPEGSDQAFTTMLDRNGYARRGRLMPEGDPFYLWAIGQTSGRGHLTPAPDVYVPRSFLRLRARPPVSVDPRAPRGCC
jgi:hypothetical protein